MIRAHAVTKRFGNVTVLDELSFSAEQGERVAVLGMNGAGKTTLMRCLLGLTEFAGQLEIAGRNVQTEGREARANIGYVPQRAPYFEGSLFELVEFFSRLRGIETEQAESRLTQLGLSLASHGMKETRELSGGMLQKVLLALALGADVPLLLLDEPTANLDARARRDFIRALGQVSTDTTVLLATHRLTDVEAVADRLLVLHGGRIAFDGRMDELWQSVGADVTLWIRVPPRQRESACNLLQRQWQTSTVLANGAALGIQVERSARAKVLMALHSEAIPVEDFWTEVPSLNDLMERLLGPEAVLDGAETVGGE